MAATITDFQQETSVCRFCSADGCTKIISRVYTWKEHKEVYSEMLFETFNINIEINESSSMGLRDLICDRCIERLRDAANFKKLVLAAEQALHLIQPSECLPITFGFNGEKETDIDIKEETEGPVDDDERLALEDVPHYSINEPKSPKEEPLFNNPNTIQKTRRKSSRLRDKMKHSTKIIVIKKSSEIFDRNDAAKTVTDKRINDNPADDAVRKNAMAILRHTTAYPFQPSKISFRCCFCPYTPSHHDPTAFRQHMDKTHAHIDKSSCLKHRNESMRRVDVTNLKCKLCETLYQSLEEISKHLVDIHNVDMDLSQNVGLVPIKLEKDRFACVICSKSYTTLHQLSRHSGTHFYRNICYKCGGNFETLKGLNKHVLIKHSTHKYYCHKCRLPFPDLNSKKEHMINSKKCQNFKCKYCKERFLNLESQQEHLVKEHGESKTTYSCPECSEVFEKRISRYLHFKMTHTEDFKCHHCGTKFSNKRCLQDHIARIHTFERKYKCVTCDRSFIDARTLRSHTFIHDESKKQVCTVCNRSFTMKIRLRQHVRKYHPEILTELFPMEKNADKIPS